MPPKKTAEPTWPADNVTRKPIKDLVPYAQNSRTHSEGQVDQIRASMREWGWTNPIIIDEAGGIIAGHGRVLAAQAEGYTEVPCITVTGWSEAQKKAYVIADNKLALNSDWDFEMLKVEMQELEMLDFDIGLTGFDAGELSVLADEDILDGFNEQREPEETSNTMIRIGSYSIMVGMDAFEYWMLGVRKDGGDDEEKIKEIFLKRLGL